MARHAESEKPKLDPLSVEALTEFLAHWEVAHLAKIDPKKANVEFGQIGGVLQKIGERCNARLIAANRNNCGACGRPLPNGRPANQFSVFNYQTGKYEEKYSCSSKCSAKLSDLQHRSAVQQQGEG